MWPEELTSVKPFTYPLVDGIISYAAAKARDHDECVRASSGVDPRKEGGMASAATPKVSRSAAILHLSCHELFARGARPLIDRMMKSHVSGLIAGRKARAAERKEVYRESEVPATTNITILYGSSTRTSSDRSSTRTSSDGSSTHPDVNTREEIAAAMDTFHKITLLCERENNSKIVIKSAILGNPTGVDVVSRESRPSPMHRDHLGTPIPVFRNTEGQYTFTPGNMRAWENQAKTVSKSWNLIVLDSAINADALSQSRQILFPLLLISHGGAVMVHLCGPLTPLASAIRLFASFFECVRVIKLCVSDKMVLVGDGFTKITMAQKTKINAMFSLRTFGEVVRLPCALAASYLANEDYRAYVARISKGEESFLAWRKSYYDNILRIRSDMLDEDCSYEEMKSLAEVRFPVNRSEVVSWLEDTYYSSM